LRMNNVIRRHLCNTKGNCHPADEVTGTNLRIIRFLKANENRDVFQKDVEKEFGITRSTASRVLSLMEKKNLIQRSSVAHDARLKRVTLTDRSRAFASVMFKRCEELEEQLFRGFSAEEEEMVLSFLQRMHDNLG